MINKKTKFLVIDDDYATLVLVKATLTKRGYTDIDVFQDSQKASVALSTNSYDVLILDLYMPKIDGFTLLQQISHSDNPMPCIIAMTAHAEQENKIRALELGAKTVLTKPFDINLFVQEVELQITQLN